MTELVFDRLLEMSLAGGVATLCVLALGLLLRKAPKVYAYALWAVVLLRLLCPVELESGISLVPRFDGVQLPQATPVAQAPARDLPTEIPVTEPLVLETNETWPAPTEAPAAQAPKALSWQAVAGWVWLAGFLGMLSYSGASLWHLRRRLREAMPLEHNVWVCDQIPGPFVLGLVRPKIYLPSALSPEERGYVLAHEKCHIRRLDHLTRVLGYLALCLHWFNPLVWVAYIQSGRDMEMSCDEAVVKALGPQIRGDYAATLLRFATGRSLLATPLAFGEGDPKGRIRNLGRWKKPVLWVSLGAGVLCAVLAVCLITTRPQQTPYIYQSHARTQGLSHALTYGLRGGPVSGSLRAEHWKDGALQTASAPMTFDSGAKGFHFTLAFGQSAKYDYEAQISMTANGPEGTVDASLKTAIPFQLRGNGLGWSFTYRNGREKLSALPGQSHLLGGWFIGGNGGVTVEDLSDLDQHPELLRDLEEAILIRVNFTEPAPSVGDAQAGTATLTAVEAEGPTAHFRFDSLVSGTLGAELWVDGERVQREELTFRSQDLPVQWVMDGSQSGTAEAGRFHTSLQFPFDDGVEPVANITFPMPQDKTILTAAWTWREAGSQLTLGQEATLAAWYFDTGSGVRAYTCEDLDRDPELTAAIPYAIVLKLRLREPEQSVSVGVTRNLMNLDQVLYLAQKGREVTWADFEGYGFEEVGFGRYIRHYETTGPFYLRVGGSPWEDQPEDVHLCVDADTSIELTAGEDPEAFIDEQLKIWAVRESRNGLRLRNAEDSDRIRVLSLLPLEVRGGWMEGRMTVYGQALWESFTPEGDLEESRRENVVVTFQVSPGAALTPTGYTTVSWDDPNFVADCRRWFPEELLEQALVPAENLATENQERLKNALDSQAQIQALLDDICSSPQASSNPGDYIQAHKESFDALADLGPALINDCYRRYCREGLQTDLRTQVLARAWYLAWVWAEGDAYLADKDAEGSPLAVFVYQFTNLAQGKLPVEP